MTFQLHQIIHCGRLGLSTQHFFRLAEKFALPLRVICLFLLCVGLYVALIVAPVDYQQGHSYRIMFIHVPSAWMSLELYLIMALLALISLVWRIKVAEVMMVSCAPVGAMFTTIALFTGAMWGKPMWGAWWVWDARLTSELILLFLYLGIISLKNAVDDPRQASRLVAILVLMGSINIPIVHFSVQWWSTLHQGTTFARFDQPSIHPTMLLPLFIMVLAFHSYSLMTILDRARLEILRREKSLQWFLTLRNTHD